MITGETKSVVDFIDNPDYVTADTHTPSDHVACTLTTQEPVTWNNLLTELNWFQVAVPSLMCVLAFVVAYFSHPRWETGICGIMYCYMTGPGITTGYRRLWFHRSYKASRALRYALALVCAGAVGGLVIWWARNQCSHHRYPDTDLDRYYAYKGLLWSYINWVVVKPSYKSGVEESDVSDLSENDIARRQYQHYLRLAFIMRVISATVVAVLGFADWKDGYVYAVCFGLSLSASTSSINSLAHWLGGAFDHNHTLSHHLITTPITDDDSYHTFHHQFPADYRNAIK
ncbi:hypothetical protein EDC04DRAFT_2586776 [Pisolithus marmoratus]|nr:hypothetical protein EDC04DRAFT_2586776 [Pisolithus marmoratus]